MSYTLHVFQYKDIKHTLSVAVFFMFCEIEMYQFDDKSKGEKWWKVEQTQSVYSIPSSLVFQHL